MGTRGLMVYRCRGRYFTYHNQYDSYPEGLGQEFVDSIPKDPAEYQAWLEALRHIFSRLVDQFETQCLPVVIQPLEEEDSDPSLAERYEKSYFAVDDEINHPPLQIMPLHWRSTDHEWFYTVDLDKEIFSIDFAVHLHLSKLPHDPNWITYLGKDVHRRRAADKCTPLHMLANPAFKPEVNSASIAAYRLLDVETVTPESFYLPQDISFHRETFLTFICSCMQSDHRAILDGSYLEWEPKDLPFREIAYAFLSLATGNVSLESIQHFDRNHEAEGYFLVRGEGSSDSESLMPRFLCESHYPGVEAGSSPQQTTYWMDSVLVHLVSGLDRVEVEEAAIAEAVEFGLKQGRTSFYAIVFSILDVVLLRVRTTSGKTIVQRSPVMSMFEFNDTNSSFSKGPRSRPSPSTEGNDSTDDSRLEKKISKVEAPSDSETIKSVTALWSKQLGLSPTFITMLRFFDAAVYHDLEGAVSRVLPNETLSAVMEHTDIGTYRIMSNLSAYCRNTSLSEFRLNDKYALIGFDFDNVHYTLKNTRTGKQSIARMRRTSGDGDELVLSPVIGIRNPARRSIIDSIQLCFLGIIDEDAPYTKAIEMPEPICYCLNFYDFNLPSKDDDKLLHLRPHEYTESVWKGWDQYIQKLLWRYLGNDHNALELDKGRFRCLVPPRYREITMRNAKCSGLHCFLRHARDETDEEWELTLRYALRRLSVRETSRNGYASDLIDHNFLPRGRPVVIGFSTRVKLFYYVHHRRDESPAVYPDAGDLGTQAAERCTNPDPGQRLVPLIPDIIDLRDDASRAQFEGWFQRFCGAMGEKTEYDPFSNQQQPLICVPEQQPDTAKSPMTSTEPVGSDVVYDLS
ncbi:uncharacterized protein BO97DRAFT_474443 [Aspergillus homomorphus CBS 101889]|uniref:Uncharacterized protein n=1 Tax=Aspergillus homomorphus (strain CBS 101889) TaxID=1450537 RepID=A0A395IE50_ASPHC|nr:hypothetical protein BO97DRAFT_474443 [Aspergillus homomorphus CBS 101889]RAL17443.1 hypothetical protein BO97DRAFT_474443 [Aspergillus homomorphus CBS 101889]